MSGTDDISENRGLAAIRLWGPFSRAGLIVALLAFIADQLHKYWMIEIYRIADRGRVEVASFLDLVMVWNPGVSYGLFPADSETGRLVLVGFSLLAVIVLILWMSNVGSRLVAISIGLIVGGALGNMVDRIYYGAVADFFSFHFDGFYWYVFNIADVTITAGVIGLIIDWLIPSESAHHPGERSE